MRRIGYIFTLVTAIFALLLLSLISFYLESSQMDIERASSTLSTEELHYFIENVKDDLRRASEISGRRAIVYLINETVASQRNLSDYGMINCTPLLYNGNGSDAAMAELILCGTLDGNPVGFMFNNTLENWSQQIQGERFGLELETMNLTIAMYDPWNLGIILWEEIYAENIPSLFHSNVTVVSLIPIEGLEEPLHHLRNNEPSLSRKFSICRDVGEVNGTVINEWLESGCYHSSNISYGGASFLDRLDGRIYLSERYLNASNNTFYRTEIGLESFADLFEFYKHGIPVTMEAFNYSWIDYEYWKETDGVCCVNNTWNYGNVTFHIDSPHREKYNITEYDCDGICNATFKPYPA